MTPTVTCFTRNGTVSRLSLSDALPPAGRELARTETYQWIKSLRLVQYDGQTMRARFRYKGDSLWWFTELYLHKLRHLEEAVATILALDRVRERFDPARLEVEAEVGSVRDAAIAFGRARGVPVSISGAPAERRAGFASYREALIAGLSRLRPGRPGRHHTPQIAAFVHNAFWRQTGAGHGGEESYIGPVLDRLKQAVPERDLALVGVGPARNFRARRWWDPVVRRAPAPPSVTPVEQFSRGIALESNGIWRRRRELAHALTAGAGIRAAATIRGCDLWPVLRRELTHVAELQWPWSARVMDEAGAALDVLSPRVVVTYAEAGGWGRAIVLEARRRGVRSVGIQHGFIYRHWLNYLHEADEMAPLDEDRGFPAPDRTLLFDAFAAEHLRTAGRLPASGLIVTGSARLDDLKARVEAFRRDGRDRLRETLGVGPENRLLLLAAKFSEIRSELPAVFEAVGRLPAVRMIVKTHPAETSAPYEALAAGVANISVATADTDLARLVAAADGLVTMNSTVAVDALVLDVPALVVGWPTNLSPFVEAGAMLGGPDTDLDEALNRLLYHQPSRDALRHRATEFARAFRIQGDGGAAERASNEILAAIT
jgi:hypothetical protein